MRGTTLAYRVFMSSMQRILTGDVLVHHLTEDERMIASSACDVVRLNLTRPEDDQRR